MKTDFMLGAHKRILPKQSVIPAISLEQFSPVRAGKLVSNLPFLAESKISNMFDIFCHGFFTLKMQSFNGRIKVVQQVV